MSIKSFLGKQIDDKNTTNTVVLVAPRHNAESLEQLTKKEVIAYAHKYNIKINTRRKKEELIEIILKA